MLRRIELPESELTRLKVELGKFSGAPLNTLTPSQARAQLAERRARRDLQQNGQVRVYDDALPRPTGQLSLRRYQTTASRKPGTIVYCHGGGWVLGRPDDFDATCIALAKQTAVEVVSVDYRLAPEHPYPAALEDIVATLETLVAGVPDEHSPVILAGESAGGNLALAAAMLARDRRIGSIAALALFYPVTDYVSAAQSADASRDSPLLRAADLPWFWAHYLPEAWMHEDPLAAPGRNGQLNSLPPTLVVHGTRDPVSPSAAALARRIAQAGVDSDEWICEGLPHAFTALPGLPTVTCIVIEAAQWIEAKRLQFCRASHL